jgi:uncharacterized SAM-dependent methyltransferase
MIFSESQLNEIVDSIITRAEIPMKYEYMLKQGADSWKKISEERMEVKDKTYSLTYWEIEQVKGAVNHVLYELKECKEINLIDLGCGTGEPAFEIAKYLEKEGISVRYIPVDISSELLIESSKLFKKEGFEIYPIHLDFDSQPIRPQIEKYKEIPSFYLLLGNTLGNHSNEIKILVNIRESMSINDYLFVGLYMYYPFKLYSQIERYKEDKHNEQLLTAVIKEFGIENYEFSLEWYEQEKLIIAKITMQENTKINIKDKVLEFNKGDVLIVGRSKRYTEDNIVNLATNSGVRIVDFSVSKNNLVSVLTATPRRWV